MRSEDYYQVIQEKDYLVIIREQLDKIDSRYLTKYTNLFLVIGNKECLLIDTGCGFFPLKPIINKFLNGKKLYVVNTHSHFDHVGGNGEFDTIYIHENEEAFVKNELDLTFLKEAPNTIVNRFNNTNLILPPSKKIIPLKGGEIFELGGIDVRWIHNAGHSTGSISLYTDKGELFPGDLVHYGAIPLPPKDDLSFITESVEKLIKLYDEKNINEIYPSHEDYGVSKDILTELLSLLKNIDDFWENRIPNKFNNAWEIDMGGFHLMLKVGIKERKDFRTKVRLLKEE
ncbi:MAG: MBL fold metallo-hydrolase [Promethearchaeota archaeon]